MSWTSAIESILKNSEKTSIILMDHEGSILEINAAVTKIFGFNPDDLIGQHIRVLFTKEDRLKHLPEKELETVTREGSALDENYVVQKDGKPLWCFGESIRIKSEGKLLFLKIIFNIQRQKQLETDLIARNEELQQAKQNLILVNEELVKKMLALDQVNKELDSFAYTVSHDLKAPLNNLELLLKMLSAHVNPSSEASRTEQMITKSIQKLKNLIEDFAMIAKMQADQIPLAEPVSLREVMDEVKFNLKHQIEISGAVIKEDFSAVASVSIPKRNIKSILQNLVSNAIKYRSPDRLLHIRVEAKPYKSSYILLIVADNGLGIKRNDQEKIFSMYMRVHEIDHKDIEGTGMGLAIVKRMVENHGGKIDIESAEGRGSAFMVYLKQS